MSTHKKYLFAALILSALVLTVHRATYFRPFFTNPESQASYDAMNHAQANRAGIFPNPFLTRMINLEKSEIVLLNHWPNPYFLVLEGWNSVFGHTERSGRAFAVLASLIGLFFLAASVARTGPETYLAVPLLLLSGLGRYAIPAVFINPAVYLFVGLMAWAITWRKQKTLLISAILSVVFVPPMLPITTFGLILPATEPKTEKRHLLRTYTFLFVLVAFIATVGLLSVSGDGQFRTNELLDIIAKRTSFAASADDIGISFASLPLRIADTITADLGFRALAFKAFKNIAAAHWVNFGILALIVAGLGYGMARRKQYVIPAFMLGFAAYAVVFRNFVGAHNVNMFLFLALLVMGLVWYVTTKADEFGRVSASWGFLARPAALGVVLVVLLSTFVRTDPFGKIDLFENQKAMKTWGAFHDLLKMPSAWKTCNAFVFEYDKEHYDPSMGNWAQFYVGKNVIDRINNKKPIQKCRILLQYDYDAGPVVSVEKLWRK